MIKNKLVMLKMFSLRTFMNFYNQQKKLIKAMIPMMLIHGGADDILEERIPGKISGVKKSVQAGYQVLQNGGSAVDAVETAIRVMEDDEYFNAGYGSVLNLDGEVEMCSSIMNGTDLNVGAVALVKDVAHPISLARKVMENSPHSLIGAHGASRFAKEQNIPIVDPASLVTENAKRDLQEFKRTGVCICPEIEIDPNKPGQSEGTVGAVAVDKFGHVAAGTSTGGLTGKMVGRIGDSPQIGSGAYADDFFGGVSTTGHGESILKYCVAHNIIKEMELGKSAEEATKISIDGMTTRLKNTAGAITLSKTGDIGIYFTSNKMAWAYVLEKEIHFGIKPGQHDIEKV